MASNLVKRVDALEQAIGGKAKAFLWVEHASDGGLVHDGQFYADEGALLRALGHESDEAFIFHHRGEPKTAAELLATAEERAKNPPPPVSIDDLGEYGRKLVEEQGVSPAVAKHLEALQPKRTEDPQ